MNCWVPDSLDVDAVFRGYGAKLAERVVWLGHTVFTRLAVDPRCRDTGMAPLHSTILRRLLGWRYLGPARELAESIGYVQRDRSYSAGRFSQSYSIGREYAHARLVQYTLTDAGLLESIRRERDRIANEQAKRLAEPGSTITPEVFARLKTDIDRLKIDADVQAWTPTEQIVIDRIRRRSSWAKVCEYGRLHTVLTSTPRRLRSNLHIGGKRLTAVDIGESQPLFIGLALPQDPNHTKPTTHNTATATTPLMLHMPSQWGEGPTMLHAEPADLGDWLGLCERRGLYQAVGDVLRVSRKAVKEPVMAALFGKPHHTSRASRALETLFPATWEAIQELKRTWGYASLAHAAQRAESGFIFGRCVRRLMAEHPGLWLGTIHDSILTTAGSEGIVHDLMADEFEKLGLNPRLTVERFCESDC